MNEYEDLQARIDSAIADEYGIAPSAESPSEDERLHGGEIWTQKGGSCFTCYTVFIDLDQWVLIQPPDRQGNMAWNNDPNHEGVFYTKAELLHRFDSMGYECEGQFSDILKASNERLWRAAKADCAHPPESREAEPIGYVVVCHNYDGKAAETGVPILTPYGNRVFASAAEAYDAKPAASPHWHYTVEPVGGAPARVEGDAEDYNAIADRLLERIESMAPLVLGSVGWKTYKDGMRRAKQLRRALRTHTGEDA